MAADAKSTESWPEVLIVVRPPAVFFLMAFFLTAFFPVFVFAFTGLADTDAFFLAMIALLPLRTTRP